MTRPELTEDSVTRTLAELRQAAIPVEEAQRAAYRRERIVGKLALSIEAQANQPRARARTWLWMSAAAAVVLTGLGSFWALAPHVEAVAANAESSAGETRTVLGEVSVQRGGAATPLHTGDMLVGGEVVSTAARSGVELGIASGHADLGASSELELVRPSASERRLKLGVGSVDVDLPRKLEAGRHLVVETPDVDVVVVGTAFTVEVGGDGAARATHVSVRRGTVWIMQGGKQRAVLRAGDDWRSPPRTPVVAPPAAPEATETLTSARRSVAVRAKGASRPADSGTLEEENRLFQSGLAARNAGDNAGAADAFASLLSRYPRTVLREQALAGEFRALERAGRSSAATAAARRYLTTYPAGFAHGDAERVANRL